MSLQIGQSLDGTKLLVQFFDGRTQELCLGLTDGCGESMQLTLEDAQWLGKELLAWAKSRKAKEKAT